MAEPDTVLVCDPAPGVRLLTLNRPEVRNAIDMHMAARLASLLDQAAVDPELRCLIVTGADDKAFSAGFDIREMSAFDAAEMQAAFVRRDPLMLQIASHPLPVIAALNGLAHGAGALIAAACDFRIACPRSEFRVTAINYGSANATWSLPRIVGLSKAKDIIMTGRCVSAEDGLRIGLYDQLCDADALRDTAIAQAMEIACKPSEAVMAAKRLINGSGSLSISESWEAEHRHVLDTLSSSQRSGDRIFVSFPRNT